MLSLLGFLSKYADKTEASNSMVAIYQGQCGEIMVYLHSDNGENISGNTVVLKVRYGLVVKQMWSLSISYDISTLSVIYFIVYEFQQIV